MKKYEKKPMDYNKTKEKALRLLEFRTHSKKELEVKLAHAGANSEDITRVIEFLQEYNFINDKDYAKRYAMDLQNLKKIGKRRIYLELNKKGLDAEFIEEAISNLSQTDEDELLKMVDKKIKGDFDKKNKDRVIRYFLTRGYSFDEIKRCINQLDRGFEE